MNSEILSEWMKRQAHSVIQTVSSSWVDAGPGVYQAIPYHFLFSPTEDELLDFLRKEKAIALRYSTPLDSPKGSISYHVVYERNHYSQQDLPKKARYDVRKGLSVAKIEPISLDRLAGEGWGLRNETLIRQGRAGAETETWWRKLCLSAKGLPGFEAWGAIVNDKLVASLFAFVCDNCFSIFYQQSLTDFLSFGVNNALTYAVTSEVLCRPGPFRIFYGLHSLDAPASVDEFKFRMGYVAKPVRQRVVFNPWARPFVNNLSYSLLRTGHRVFPSNYALSKSEGIFRFYLQGNRRLSDQDWPVALNDCKGTILVENSGLS